MQKPERSTLAGDLAQAFAYAELHCNLLQRYLQGGLPTVPKIPPFEAEEAALNKLSRFIDADNVSELRASLSNVAMAFQHAAGGGFRSSEECNTRIEGAKTRLRAARRWLAEFAEDGTPKPLKQINQSGELARQSAARKSSGGKLGASLLAPEQRMVPIEGGAK